jgi:hypothetical protein
VAVSPDGRTVIVTGLSGSSAFATVAYNAATGAQEWAKSYNGPVSSVDRVTAIGVNPAGTLVYVTGSSYGGSTAGYQFATVAYNATTGGKVWVTRSRFATQDGGPIRLAVSPTGSTVYVTGLSSGAYRTFAYSATTGGQIWTRRYQPKGTGPDIPMAIAVNPTSGSVYVTGTVSAAPASFYATVAYSG